MFDRHVLYQTEIDPHENETKAMSVLFRREGSRTFEDSRTFSFSQNPILKK